MTHSHASIVALMDLYLAPGFDYPISLLEIQKLVYFLKEAGEDLPRFDFVKHQYGPYADALLHVLEGLEGHFITGYGAGENKPDMPMQLLPGAVEEAAALLKESPKTLSRFDRVAELIEGFETPLGMELLATVHWVAARERDVSGPETALRAIQSWSTRKAKLMSAEQVSAAWVRLADLGWLQPAN